MSTPTLDLVTQPNVYRDELPSCCGNCNHGERACPHPLTCAGIEAPKHSPAVVPLKAERVQVDAPRRAVDVYASSEVQQAARRDRIKAVLIDRAWWFVVALAVIAAYSLAKN